MERERWYAILLFARGWTASATAEALKRDQHTIGRWEGVGRQLSARAGRQGNRVLTEQDFEEVIAPPASL